MVVGFNHNFRYRGEVFHVQTEDGGLNTTNIITLLYRGGTILARQKTSYADIAKVDNLDKVVEELMKEQHKEMLKRLKTGEFDQRVDEILAGKKPAPVESAAAATVSAAAEPVIAIKPEPVAPPPLKSPHRLLKMSMKKRFRFWKKILKRRSLSLIWTMSFCRI